MSQLHEDDDDRDNDDDSFEDMGFMFEGAEPKSLQSITFTPQRKQTQKQVHLRGTTTTTPSCADQYGTRCKDIIPGNESKDTNKGKGLVRRHPLSEVHVDINSVDDDPGAVQSGHYLWPAASSLAQFLVDEYLAPAHDDNGQDANAEMVPHRTVLELGAGCGLAGLVALQIFGNLSCSLKDEILIEPLSYLVFSDHDPGTLELAKSNYESTLSKLRQIESLSPDGLGQYLSGTMSLLERIASISVAYEHLSWGDDQAADDVLGRIPNIEANEFINNNNNHTAGNNSIHGQQDGFDLILGSDLIYSHSVVQPLFSTVSRLLSRSNPSAKFIMAQSFGYDLETEDEIRRSCSTLGLERTIVVDEGNNDIGDSGNGGKAGEKLKRIQEFKTIT